MLKRQFGVLAKSLLVAGLCVSTITPTWAQSQVSFEVQQRSEEIQKIIDRSDERLQAGEIHFKEGNYDQARRAYDRAIDIILESGVDVRSDARLRQHYQNLVEHIFQRQLALLKPSAAPQTQTAFLSAGSTPQVQLAGAQTGPQGGERRGFGQQLYEPSPLDELANLKLTDEELKGATDAEAQSAVAAAKLDFGFKPNALVQSFI